MFASATAAQRNAEQNASLHRTVLQRLLPDDSLVYAYPGEFLVTATRLRLSTAETPAPVQVFTASAVAALPVASLADLLRAAQGCAVQSYGGNGSVQLASLRGLGAEYAVLYRDGVRLNSPQNGLADLSLVDLASCGSVEIARGGFASLYGGDALGGVIALESRRDAPCSITLGASSFGGRSASGGLSLGGGRASLGASVRYEEARNDYPFTPRASVSPYETLREHAGFVRRAAALTGHLAAGSGSVALAANLVSGSSQVPGAYYTTVQGDARQDDLSCQVSLTGRAPAGPSLALSVTPSFFYSEQRYRDPQAVMYGMSPDARYVTSVLGLAAAAELDAGGDVRSVAGAEMTRGLLQSDELTVHPSRLTLAAFASGDIPAPIAGMRLRIFPSLRFDALRDEPPGQDMPSGRSETAFSPSLALRLPLAGDSRGGELLAARLRAAAGFRAPTFNQLYWSLYGNPDLRSERALSFDGGLVLRAAPALAAVEVTAFLHEVKDRIVWVEVNGMFWTPRNVERVRSTGLEASAEGMLPWFDASYAVAAAWTSAVKASASFPGDPAEGKQLPCVPRVMASLRLDLPFTDFLRAGIIERYTGERFSSGSNTPNSRLAPFALTDAAVTLRRDIGGANVALKLEALNIFDASYEIIAFYPMPGRSFRASLTTELPRFTLR